MAKRQENATLLDVVIDAFEKNEVHHGFHWRELPMPDEEAAARKFATLSDEARRWKGVSLRSEAGVGTTARVVAGPRDSPGGSWSAGAGQGPEFRQLVARSEDVGARPDATDFRFVGRGRGIAADQVKRGTAGGPRRDGIKPCRPRFSPGSA